MWKDSLLAQKIVKINYSVHLVALALLVFNILTINSVDLIDWDEGVFALQAKWLATFGLQGKPFNFQTPPLFPALVALFFKIFGTHDIVPRAISIVFSFLTLYLLYFFVRDLFTEKEAVYATILFAITEFFLFFSGSGLSDAFFLFIFLLSLYLFIQAVRQNRIGKYLLATLFVTVAFYTKYSSIMLIFILFILGMTDRNSNKKMVIISNLIPVILFIPYLYLFIRLVGISGISSRHLHLLGFNHLKFLYYIIAFGLIPGILSLVYIFSAFTRLTYEDRIILTIILIYLLGLGFYYPYFRLAYPLIPFLSILASRFFTTIINRRYRVIILTVSIIVSLWSASDTLTYTSKVPEEIGSLSRRYTKENRVNYLITAVPPNINFYIPGSLTIQEGSDWFRLGKRFPCVILSRKILKKEEVLFRPGEQIIIIYSSIFDALEKELSPLIKQAKLLNEINFIDAPVYYKDIFNPLRNRPQNYRFYLLTLKEPFIYKVWSLSFLPGINVFYQE